MGVKSTVNISRAFAEQRYVEFKLEEERRRIRSRVCLLDNKELENQLEHLNDKAHGGEGFENYIIV